VADEMIAAAPVFCSRDTTRRGSRLTPHGPLAPAGRRRQQAPVVVETSEEDEEILFRQLHGMQPWQSAGSGERGTQPLLQLGPETLNPVV
jgi:hypothetical protein